LALLVVLFQGTWALAGTSGTLVGQVVLTDGTMLAGANVTATSPSESVSTTTDATGHFAFVSLIPDTYTITVSKDGYDSVSQAGVTVQADNSQSVSVTTQKSAKVLGTIPVRAAAELVKPGTTADVYSVNARSAAKMVNLGGGGGQDNAYSALASLPGVYVPTGQSGWYQNVYIRGGDYDQVGYEYDGVPVNRSFDNYPTTTASSLGQQQLQVYTGSAPSNAQSQGLAGFINQVIKTGTYPGFGLLDVAVGGPNLYNKLNIEAGGATPNRNFSYYIGIGGYNLAPRTFDNNNGASLTSTYGAPFGATSNYESGVAPDGYILAPFNIFNTAQVSDRETVANFHIGLPHKNDAGKDDLQFLYSTSLLRNPYYSSAQDFGLPFLQTNNGGNFVYFGGFQYNGNLGDTFTSGPVAGITQYSSPSSGTQAWNFATHSATFAPIPSDMRDSSENGQGIGKIQYQHNIGSNAYLRLYGYSFYSWWFLHGDVSNNMGFVACCPSDYELETHTRGGSLEFQDQIDSKNLLGFQMSYTTATSIRDNNTQGLGVISGTRERFAVLVNSANPRNGVCYNINDGVTPLPASCEPFALGDGPNPLNNATFVKYDAAFNGTYTAAPAGFEYLVAENGPWATYNSVKPKFTSVNLTDGYKASDKLLLNGQLRVDRFEFDGSATDGGTRDFWFNAWNMSQCVLNAAGNKPVDKSSLGLDPTQACPAGYHVPTFTNISSPVYTYTEFQPRLGGTYTMSSDDVLRFSYGTYVQAPNAAFEQYNSSDQNLPARLGNTFNFYAFGFTTPGHQLGPEKSYNTDFSWEHHFKGSDVSFKLSPFYRKTKDQYQQFYLDQVTNFVSGLPVGNQVSSGVEFELNKGDFSANGLSGMFTYTYTHSYITLSRLSNGGTVFSGINNNIASYNAYTKGCAGNTTNPACGGGFDSTGTQIAAACYTTGGVPDASCAAGDIANPYWNAPVRPLFDPNAQYVPFDIIPGGFNASVSSFEVPNVATLILNFKHDKLAITPAFQYHSGGYYGAPLQSPGVNPAAGFDTSSTCALGPVLGSPTGDPRYPYGAPGGGAYNAQCALGTILIPNPFSGNFDQPGAFKEPSQLSMHLQLTYEATSRLTLVGSVLNLINTCTGGTSAPWTAGATNKMCGYSLPGYGGLAYTGNVYNPGTAIQQIVKYPYMQNYNITPLSYTLEAKVSL
jgi:Carboxypeptidase regulatory-like domain/TonB dependent receptor/TonB-dependent Receptor Plug Domain